MKVNKVLLPGDNFRSAMYLRQAGFTYSTCGTFTKNKDTIPNLKKQEIHDKFIKTNYGKLVFNVTWLTDILKIQPEEQLLIKNSMVMHLILLKIKNMMDIKEVL